MQKIPDGAVCLTPAHTCKKLARSKSWLWDRVARDPAFPKPIYLGARSVFVEQHLDEWLRSQAERKAAA